MLHCVSQGGMAMYHGYFQPHHTTQKGKGLSSTQMLSSQRRHVQRNGLEAGMNHLWHAMPHIKAAMLISILP
jgi:hypothetical protein